MAEPVNRDALTIPAVQRHGNAVLLCGQAVLDLHYLVALGIREVQARDGITPSRRLRELQDTLAAAANDMEAVSGRGHADVPEPSRVSPSGRLDEIGTKEAAAMLQISTRQARRLAPEIGARRGPGGNLTFPRAAVDAYAAHRRSKETAA